MTRVPSAQERCRSLARVIRAWRIFDRVSARILWGLSGLSFILLAVVMPGWWGL